VSAALRLNSVCSTSSIRVPSRSRWSPEMKTASAGRSGSSTGIGARSVIFSSPKAWLGSGKDRAGVGANETDDDGSTL